MIVHRATCSCSVELYKLWYILWRIFCQTGIFRGVFSTHHWYRRIHPHSVIFRGFFLYINCRKDQRSCDVRGGPDPPLLPPPRRRSAVIIFHSTGRREIIIPRVPECMPYRRNWSPPPLWKWVCLPPLIQRWGRNTLLQGTQFGRLDRNPGTLYTLWPRW